jgi:hypothetical protein
MKLIDHTAKYYYECHITIEPVFEDWGNIVEVEKIATKHGFKLAKLLMQKRSEDQPERSSKDTFMTSHGKELLDLTVRMKACCEELQAFGLIVYRYKIEDIVLDSRIKDEFNLLDQNVDILNLRK